MFSTLLLLLPLIVSSGTPAPAQYYSDQLVDHDNCCSDERWTQRYYVWGREFLGPGHPIFLIIGGEGNVEPSTGLFYPFVTHHLAKDFGAFVLEPEHRFYGESQPSMVTPEDDPREKLFTSKQALQDAMRLIGHYQSKLGCSQNKTSPEYCPVITVGGSYPGWLSAMARLVFPDVVDMAYAASAPMTFYSQEVDPGAYYEHISKVAEQSLSGCFDQVQHTLYVVNEILQVLPLNDLDDIVEAFGFCLHSRPDYIKDMKTLADELFMIIGYTFANDNMANYPPGNTTRLYGACKTFSSNNLDPIQKVNQFIKQHLLSKNSNKKEGCVDMRTQMPTGPNSTISGGDWSGVGFGTSGESWDFQTCTLLVEQIGFSPSSMFPPRNWTLDWMTEHCQSRFGVTPQPYKLVKEWRFDDLAGATNASHIIFTNGLNDGWSVGGIQTNLSDTLLALNFENGAHHSDLSGKGPSDRDTPDIQEGFKTIRTILADWLNELQPERYPMTRAAKNLKVPSVTASKSERE